LDEPQVSYNAVDGEVVIAVRNLLSTRDITLFLDGESLLSAFPWPQALVQGLLAVWAMAARIGRQTGGWQKRKM
jgi:hypothetical protein